MTARSPCRTLIQLNVDRVRRRNSARSAGRFMMSLCGLSVSIDQIAASAPSTSVIRSSVMVALSAKTSATGPSVR